MDYVSDKFGETPMSSVRWSMKVVSVRPLASNNEDLNSPKQSSPALKPLSYSLGTLADRLSAGSPAEVWGVKKGFV
eukprot:scaffold53653_cov70-Phaeocystis_antarctica.AAC.1